jgi:hypothetical protein
VPRELKYDGPPGCASRGRRGRPSRGCTPTGPGRLARGQGARDLRPEPCREVRATQLPAVTALPADHFSDRLATRCPAAQNEPHRPALGAGFRLGRCGLRSHGRVIDLLSRPLKALQGAASAATSSVAAIWDSGIATIERQSRHVQQVNLRIHVPCSYTPEATSSFEPHSGHVLSSLMAQASAARGAAIKGIRSELVDRHSNRRRTGAARTDRGLPPSLRGLPSRPFQGATHP